MDPVNKWLTTVIFFMAAFLAVLCYKAGNGRYEVVVTHSAVFADHVVVSVIDTKDGDIHSKLVDENDLLNSSNRAYTRPQKVFEVPSFSSGNRRY